MIGLTHKQIDPLAEIKAALDANPFADPVRFGGQFLPRRRARALERHLIAARRGKVAA
jgi:hypothetical protein